MVSRKTVAKLMRQVGLVGIPRRQSRKNPKVVVSSEDLVYRDFLRSQPKNRGKLKGGHRAGAIRCLLRVMAGRLRPSTR